MNVSRHGRRSSRGRGLDRSRCRQHVQRQERRAHPPAAARADRQAQGPDLQAADRQPLQRRPHHLAQRDADPRRERRQRRASCSSRCCPTPRSSASTRGSSSTPSCPRSAARWPTRASGSSSPASTRTTWASRSSRCRSCSRSPNTSPRRWRSAWSAARPANHTQRLVASSERVAGRRPGHLRGALPALLRSAAGPVEREGARREVRRRGRSRRSCSRAALSSSAPASCVINLQLFFQYVRKFAGIRSTALLTWPPPRPPLYRLFTVGGRGARDPHLLQAGGAQAAPEVRLRRDDDAGLLRLRAAARREDPARASTRTASGPTAASSPYVEHRRADVARGDAADPGPALPRGGRSRAG